MAKSISGKKRKPKKVTYNSSVYQIHVKGPERNETLKELFDHVRQHLLHGDPLVKADRHGNVVRAIGALSFKEPSSVELTVVKYNSIKTGLAWDTELEKLVEEKSRVTAQRTKLIIYPDEHRAVLVHKNQGPTPSQVVFYLNSLFELSAQELEIDCTIDVVPLKVGGKIKSLSEWKVIKKFSIEVFRPNPDGSIKAKAIKKLLERTSSDKAEVSLAASEKSGIKHIHDLITDGARLVEMGQARVAAEGINSESEKDKVDSKEETVRKFKVVTDTDDNRSLPSILFDNLKKWFGRRG